MSISKLLNTMGKRVILILMIIQFGNHLLSQSSKIETFDLRKNSVYLEFGNVQDLFSFSVKYDRTFGPGSLQSVRTSISSKLKVNRATSIFAIREKERIEYQVSGFFSFFLLKSL